MERLSESRARQGRNFWGAGGLKPPNNSDDAKICYVSYTAFRRSENASTSITTW